VLPGSDAPFGSQNVVIIASTLVYGVLATTLASVSTGIKYEEFPLPVGSPLANGLACN